LAHGCIEPVARKKSVIGRLFVLLWATRVQGLGRLAPRSRISVIISCQKPRLRQKHGRV